MAPQFLSGDARSFLRSIGVPSGQWLEVRAIPLDGSGPRQHFCRSVDEALAVVGRLSGQVNVYLSACPRSVQAGTRDAVTVVTGTWADLDFHQIHPDRETAERIALSRLNSFSLPPTILVHSGNGLQAWWLYDHPVALSDESPAEKFESINRGIAKVLGGDAVHDLARVLRVPGTMNLPDARKRARGCVPVMARLLYADGPTWSPGRFKDSEALAPSVASRKPTPPASIAQADRPDNEILDAFEQLVTGLPSNHALVRTWRGDRLLNDPSRSGWDMALVNQLVHAGVRDEFIPVIVRAFPFGRGVFATDAYIARTLAKARSFMGERHGAA